ncbi:arylsulfatase [Agromyces mediolanus]|uniref:Arylsulfatase AtsA n=1 Tax=Agromyces mediolanus TaxID=41986 RepID=A0A918F8V8_AGRME|nr:arylsulfatase [Agromyces mediolanus]GGR16680.1 putative arylsulfatase AtsA [Agromyces mediolanus]GLJ73663.1 putative arylsulfatase AtsA [Agromyces mediolanus]
MREFQGEIKLDVRESKPDWDAFLYPRAKEGAPNVLVVLYDDTGQAAWSPYGGRIQMPTMDRLASGGLTYTQWHTTALCSPTRSTFLTGRNHHLNGFASISEAATGFPGYSGHIPPENGTIAHMLREAGWSTFWVGKNHNVPVDGFTMGASKQDWPLAQGFDRFYGFIGGETNQWYPDLAEDNHYIEQPYGPEDGYHLSKDLADKALSFIRDSKQSEPDKPWYLWFCPGANHAPHHAPQEYIDKYKGMFDDGYEAYREWVLPRMIERGILPEGTELTPLNPMAEGTFSKADTVRPWESLNEDEKNLFRRMAEVYAGFSEYTDAQVGRIIDYLEESGQLENTLIIYAADNGASGEGSPNGSVNENKFFNGWPDEMEENLKLLEQLGTPATYNHYPTGWAAAFSTPYRMFKRYSYQGGVCDPLVIHWPAGIQASGETRDQYHHSTDIVPTILEACGVPVPDVVNHVPQSPLSGVPMNYSFDAPDAPTTKRTQYYEMLGTRGLWHEGWKVVAEHGPFLGKGDYENDRWQLFHTDKDRAEAHDLADQHPDKVKELVELWYREAEANKVLPLSDIAASGPDLEVRLGLEYHVHVPPSGTYTYYPGTTAVPEHSAANTHAVSFKILADVDFTAQTEGVIVAQGSRFGGYSLFVKDGTLYFVYNFIGIPPEQRISAPAPVSGRHVVGVEFVKERQGELRESHGPLKLFIDDQQVGEAEIRTESGLYALSGEGLSVGYDGGDPVSALYGARFAFTGGEIHKVVYDVADDAYVDIEQRIAAAYARD